MSKKKTELTTHVSNDIDEIALYKRVSEIIEFRKARAGSFANCEVTMMYWEVGEHIGSVLLDGIRADYGKRIVATLSQQLIIKKQKNGLNVENHFLYQV